jgi:hypothetical protein
MDRAACRQGGRVQDRGITIYNLVLIVTVKWPLIPTTHMARVFYHLLPSSFHLHKVDYSATASKTIEISKTYLLQSKSN